MSIAKNILGVAKAVAQAFIPTDELFARPSGLTRQNFEDLLNIKGIADMLNYRMYEEYDGAGIFTMCDGRKGFIFEVDAPPFLGEHTEREIETFLQVVGIEGTAVQFLTYASRNIQEMVDEFERVHTCDVKLKNADILKKIIKNRADSYRRWSNSSMIGHLDLRLRNYKNLISVLLPYEMAYGAPYDDETAVEKFNMYKAALSNLGARNFDAVSLITMLREIIHPDQDTWEPVCDNNIDINQQIARGSYVRLEDNNKDTVRLGKEGWKARVLTTAKLPDSIELSGFQDLFYNHLRPLPQIHAPCPFLCSMTILFDNIKEKKDEVLSKAKWDMGQLRFLGIKEEDENPILGDRYRECKNLTSEIIKHNQIPVDCKWTLVLFEKNNKKLDEFTAYIKRSFSQADNGGWFLKEEDFDIIALVNLLYSFPLQFLYTTKGEVLAPRFDTMLRMQSTWIAPLLSEHKGFFNSSMTPGMIFIGRTGQLQMLDLYSGQNYNFIVTGPMGSGKGVLTNDIQIVSSLGQGHYCRIVDVGRSYKKINQAIGGKYIEFTEDSDISLNFFTHIVTTGEKVWSEELEKHVGIIHEDEFATIIPMIGYMCKVDLKSSASNNNDAYNDLARSYLANRLEAAVQNAFYRREYAAGMLEVWEELRILRDIDKKNGENVELLDRCIHALVPYSSKNGKYYKYFNRPNTVILDSDHIVCELEELKNKDDLYIIATMSFLQRVAVEAFYDRDRKKLIALDECKPLLHDPIMFLFIEDFGRRLRKYGGILGLITQSAADFNNGNPRLKTLYDTADWKFFLPQGDMVSDLAKNNCISMNKFQQNLFKTLSRMEGEYVEVLLQHGGEVMIGRAKMDSLSKWLFSSKQEDNNFLKVIKDTYGLDDYNAAYFASRKQDSRGALDDEQILKEIEEKQGAASFQRQENN